MPVPSVSTTSIRVRSTDIDMLGHVNNAKYLEYFEWGRFDWIEQTGFAENPLAKKLAFVVVNVNVTYRHEARRDEQLALSTRLVSRGRSSLKFAQRIENAAGVLVAEAEVTLVCFDLAERKSRALEGELAVLLDTLVVPNP